MSLLHRLADALRAAPEPPPTPAPNPVERPPLPPGQRTVKVSLDEVLAARGYANPSMRTRLVAPSDTDRARGAAETALGRGEIVWDD